MVRKVLLLLTVFYLSGCAGNSEYYRQVSAINQAVLDAQRDDTESKDRALQAAVTRCQDSRCVENVIAFFALSSSNSAARTGPKIVTPVRQKGVLETAVNSLATLSGALTPAALALISSDRDKSLARTNSDLQKELGRQRTSVITDIVETLGSTSSVSVGGDYYSGVSGHIGDNTTETQEINESLSVSDSFNEINDNSLRVDRSGNTDHSGAINVEDSFNVDSSTNDTRTNIRSGSELEPVPEQEQDPEPEPVPPGPPPPQ